MPLTTYPLNSMDYAAEDAGLFHCTRSSGVYAGDDFVRSLTGTDNTITIGVGIAWMRLSRFYGVVCAMKQEQALDLDIPDTTFPRIDAIVLRYEANANAARMMVKRGTPASNPQPPARSTTEAQYELHLYHIRREPGAAYITAANVTDLRLNAAYCGLMADSVTMVDTSAIEQQVSQLIAQLQTEIQSVKDGTAFVMKSGDAMTGNLSVPAPVAQTHAVNKGYVDTVTVSAVLTANGWAGASAPFTQTIPVAGLTDAKRALVYPVYSGDAQTDLAMRDACACVSYAQRSGGTVTFCCLEDKPTVSISIAVEVGV